MPRTFTGTFTANSTCVTKRDGPFGAYGVTWTNSNRESVESIGGRGIGSTLPTGETPCQ